LALCSPAELNFYRVLQTLPTPNAPKPFGWPNTSPTSPGGYGALDRPGYRRRGRNAKHYRDHRFGGSNSLKSVLPVIVPELSYKLLAVQNGTQAQMVWEAMIGEGETAVPADWPGRAMFPLALVSKLVRKRGGINPHVLRGVKQFYLHFRYYLPRSFLLHRRYYHIQT